MAKKYSVAVVIGRFQPLHAGHVKLINHAKSLAPKVLILMGTDGDRRSYQNPFTVAERTSMIESTFTSSIFGKDKSITVVPIEDYLYSDNLWVQSVKEAVTRQAAILPSVALVGVRKDASTSKYLDMLKESTEYTDETLTVEQPKGTYLNSGSDIREWMYSTQLDDVTETTIRAMGIHTDTPVDVFMSTAKRALSSMSSNFRWSPDSRIRADVFLECNGEFLLYRRNNHPCFTLPGGNVDAHESVTDAAINRLKESVGIDLIPGTFTSKTRMYDSPYRSGNRRTIAFVIHVTVGIKPVMDPDTQSDGFAFWVPMSSMEGRHRNQRIDEVFSERGLHIGSKRQYMDDYYHIIQDIVN